MWVLLQLFCCQVVGVAGGCYYSYFVVRWWVWLVGAGISLLAELTHELVENSEWMIQLYRNNSGTSSLYQGDSAQNIGSRLLRNKNYFKLLS